MAARTIPCKEPINPKGYPDIWADNPSIPMYIIL